MAKLRRLRDGVELPVSAQCLIGRSASCTLKIDDPYVSGEHAKLVWTGSQWSLRDLGSRNGTFVDGQRLEPGRPAAIASGARIGFGEQDAGWEVSEAGAPTAIATDLESREIRTACGELLALPDDDAPEVSIYPAQDGAGWVVEDAEGRTTGIDDGAVLHAGGRSWRLELPVISEATPMIDVKMTLDNVSFRFAVSRDEERVELTVLLRGIGTTLEPREHGYLLLTLARERRKDAHMPPDERGWRDVAELGRMLRWDANALNVATHRARQQLAAIGLEGAAGVVQVRRGKRRFGSERFEITRLPD